MIVFDTPRGIRIPVASVKGRCPRPLDDGGVSFTFTRLEKIATGVNYFLNLVQSAVRVLCSWTILAQLGYRCEHPSRKNLGLFPGIPEPD